MRFPTLSAVLGLVLLAGAGGTVAAHHRWWPHSPVAQGVRLDDRRLPDAAADLEPWLSSRREAVSARTLHLRCEQQLFTTTLGAAGISLDTAAALDEARTIAHEGSTWHRLREAERARRGEIDITPRFRLDATRARALLAAYAPVLAVAPVDASIDLTQHTRVLDVPGRELDVEASLAHLRAGAHVDEEVIDLVTRPVPARVSLAQLTAVNIEKVLSAYETTFSLAGTGAGRAVNIKKAISHFDGLVLSPGQTFSFNDVVGPRTRERGFALAPEIQGDEMQLGYGGGTCQASTTLFAAVLFGAFDVLERQAHSRPSHYAQMGLDATVSYPLSDLKFRNSMRFPVLIHAFLPNPTTVRVEILGGDPVARVEYVYGVSSTEDFVRRIQVKETLPPGQRELHQKGIPGFDVTSVVRLHYYDGREEERHYYSAYRPAPEIFWVAPGYDLTTLPPLPEHAKGTEPLEGDTVRSSYQGVGG